MANLLTTAEAYTYNGLLTALAPLFSQSLANAQQIANNTHAIAARFTAARALPEPSRSAQLAALAPLSKAQAQLVLDHKSYAAKWNAAAKALDAWAARQGIAAEGPPMLLSGLGALPVIVPIAIVAVFVTVAAVITYEAVRIGAINRILNDASLTPAQKDKLLKDSDPLARALDSLVMPLGILAVIVIGPRLLDLMPKRRAA